MRFRQLLYQLPALIAVAFLFSGCTEERAVALKTAAELFDAGASAAIDAVVELSLRSNLGKPEAEETLIKRTKQDLLATQRNKPDQIDAVISNSFKWINERQKLRRDAYTDYDKLKTAYAEFAAAYKRLPEGSFVGAQDVGCSAALGARLVNYMADAGKRLASTPVPLIYEIAQSEIALGKNTVSAVKSGNEQALDEAIRAHVALLKDQERSNNEAVAKLADAAESGAQVLDLIEKYNDLSIADLLKGLRHVLQVRESSLGLSSKAQLERLDKVVAKLNSKPALAKAL
ncbi:MAG: hypothetical protein AAB319_08485, partial [Pseudomonadota bacterium]